MCCNISTSSGLKRNFHALALILTCILFALGSCTFKHNSVSSLLYFCMKELKGRLDGLKQSIELKGLESALAPFLTSLCDLGQKVQYLSASVNHIY